MSPTSRINPVMIVVWIILIALPIASSFVAYLQLPAGIETIPTHWNFAGEVDGYGSPNSIFLIGGIMSVVNLFLAVCYFNTGKFMAMGLIHGVSPKNAPKVLLGSGVLLVIVTEIVLVATMNHVLATI